MSAICGSSFHHAIDCVFIGCGAELICSVNDFGLKGVPGNALGN